MVETHRSLEVLSPSGSLSDTSPNISSSLNVVQSSYNYTIGGEVLFGQFEVKPKHYLGNPIFTDQKLEVLYLDWSIVTRVSEARRGFKGLLVFLAGISLMDGVLLFSSDAIKFTEGKSYAPRACVLTSLGFVLVAPLMFYYNPSNTRKALENGRDVTRWFYATWAVGMIMGNVFILDYCLNCAIVMADSPSLDSPALYLNPLAESVVFFQDLIDEFGEEGPFPITEIARFASATKMLPVLISIFISTTIREVFRSFRTINALQLSFILFLQLLMLVISVALSTHFSASDYLITVIIFYLNLLIPLQGINLGNINHGLSSRVAFVKFILANRKAEELESQLEKTKKQLKELRGKLQLTVKQLKIVEANSEKLEADGDLKAYRIDLETDLQFKEKIGTGAFGVVYSANFRGETVAVKQLINEKLVEATVKMFRSEILLLVTLHHPNIITFLAFAWTAPNFAIILEYAHNGDLSAYLRKRKSKCKWGSSNKYLGRLSCCRDIVQGMRYLHTRGAPVMHRDLKLDNCLVTKFNIVKLTDFGGSREIAESKESMDNLTVCGTHWYVAPEVMVGDRYDLKCDVFSFAIVMCCLGVHDGSPRTVYGDSLKLDGTVQLSNLTGLYFASMHAKGKRISLDAFVWPKAMKDLVSACWNEDPSKRPTFDEIGKEVTEWRGKDFEAVDVLLFRKGDAER
jgi:hypothetical protein